MKTEVPRTQVRLPEWNGALLLNKHAGVSSFGMIERLQGQITEHYGVKRRDYPKMGHGGTLDPFATGLLAVCVGRAVKLARYFLGASKGYEGTFLFGQTTLPGDPTAPVSETSTHLPSSLEEIQAMARKLSSQPYLQTPPMFSAKKKDGRPLYELARAGIEVEREPKLCHLYEFEILSYEAPRAKFRLSCSSGTYVRTLAQDFGRLLGTVALLETLHRTATGIFQVEHAFGLEQMEEATCNHTPWDELPCWIPFDRLLDGYEKAYATPEETQALQQGRQNVLFNILARTRNAVPVTGNAAPVNGNVAKPADGNRAVPVAQESCLAIYEGERLVAIARKEGEAWGLERVFT